MFTSLPHSIQVEILKITDKHSTTVGVCKSMKVVADEAQLLQRKELVADIPGWQESWDAFSYITKKEWGWDDYAIPCDCVNRGECDDCEWNMKQTYWEMNPRHFSGREDDIEIMVSRVFEDRCLVSWTGHSRPPPFECTHSDLLIVFQNRTILVEKSSAGGVDVTLRDHAHNGIDPVLINQLWREVIVKIPEEKILFRTIMESMFRRAAEVVTRVLPVLGERDFAIEVDDVYILRPGRVFYLKNFHGYSEEILIEEMKAACEKHWINIKPDKDVGKALVMRAWEDAPISFQCNGVFFTSKELEKMIPEHVLQDLRAIPEKRTV